MAFIVARGTGTWYRTREQPAAYTASKPLHSSSHVNLGTAMVRIRKVRRYEPQTIHALFSSLLLRGRNAATRTYGLISHPRRSWDLNIHDVHMTGSCHRPVSRAQGTSCQEDATVRRWGLSLYSMTPSTLTIGVFSQDSCTLDPLLIIASKSI
jgi:hypothetical protein